MRFNYDISEIAVLSIEGGYVNNPKDPGGPTNKGVTQREYDAYRRRHNMPIQDVRLLGDMEAACIYKDDYWDQCGGDDLPSGLDYAMFDFTVNSGPHRAIQTLQIVCGSSTDGKWSPVLLAAVQARPIDERINALMDARLEFMKSCKHWPDFKNGWTNRIAKVRRMALHLWQGMGGVE